MIGAKNIVLLGATGSIGQSTQKVVADLPQYFRLVGLASRENVAGMEEAVRLFQPRLVAMADPQKARELQNRLGRTVLGGESGLVELATMPEADVVLVAIVGTAGLAPALAAIRAGKDLAVASKEILVMAGELVMREARARGGRVLPVDSEHSAIYQCLEGRNRADVRRLILTASGGPFRRTPREKFDQITVEEALKHPSWNMGRKITIDSATLFNKGLEMIEARWLFDVEIDRVDVLVHPQSVVHSMVEFRDGSILAQLSVPDMRYPILYALSCPHRLPNSIPPTDLAEIAALTFERPEPERFPSLRLAREAGRACGTMPAVLNAANEVAVARFVEGKIRFTEIFQTVEKVMGAHRTVASPSLDDILEADQWARKEAERVV
ncbi:MAG: 1-deoxy-D-xylulose-5-phosphate reductoisomerase [Verrucomicrobiae bacterium]|nr:1-deoxy-D-xylulose-5-phosphate reductoisomerase [Verrucomicrobiae bacterium]